MGSFFSIRLILFALLYSVGHYLLFATDLFGRELESSVLLPGAPQMEQWESWVLVGIAALFLMWRLWEEEWRALKLVLASAAFGICVTALHTFLAGAVGQWISQGGFLKGKELLGLPAGLLLILFSSALAAWLSMFLMTGMLEYALHYGYEDPE